MVIGNENQSPGDWKPVQDNEIGAVQPALGLLAVRCVVECRIYLDRDGVVVSSWSTIPGVQEVVEME